MRTTDKPTFIYGLIDPRNDQLRYVGKTILDPPDRRLFAHLWRAKTQPHKRHSMAWLLNVREAGLHPEIVTLEIVSAGGDWVEAECFWIGYFRMLGADLCNHTIGGDGAPGYKQPPEMIAKRIMRGPKNPRFGKPMLPQVKEALREAGMRLHADPARHAEWKRKRGAGVTPEGRERSIAGLKAIEADPERHARRNIKRAEAMRRPETRTGIGKWSEAQWATRRLEIIAAQNAGKDAEWKRQQSETKRREWADPTSAHQRAAIAKRRVSDADLEEIRRLRAEGQTQSELAKRFGVTPSRISTLLAGKRRAFDLN